MADAIVLITTQADKVSEAAKKIVEIPGVKDVYSVAGDVDLVAIVSADDFDDLSTIIPDGIAKVPGVAGTQTLMAFRTYSREDDLAAFDLADGSSARRGRFSLRAYCHLLICYLLRAKVITDSCLGVQVSSSVVQAEC